MIRDLLGRGEIAVVGMGRSGTAVARLLTEAGATVYASDSAAGGHDLDRIARAVLAVASPGVAPGAPPLATARAAGVPIVSEVEVALAFLPHARIVAITGTNGKTTVTALVDHLLRALGLDSVAAGNIGTPLSEIAARAAQPEWISLEMSSYQLHDTPSLRPVVGILTNLAPDHLDRYASVEDYYADKALLFRNARKSSMWVTNGDDPEVQRRMSAVAGRRFRFSLRHPGADAFFAAARGTLVLAGEELMHRSDVPLIGDHNVANVLAAALTVALASPSSHAGEDRERIAAGIRSFRALPHRLEVVAEVNGVQWIDDSKATNVSSARVAIDGMTRPTVVLLGGKHKGEPYTSLVDALRRHATRVIAYGEAAPLVAADLADHVPLDRLGSSFEEVITCARAAAKPGDAVLLSPACSSFDMFRNYEERGDTFRRLVAAP